MSSFIARQPPIRRRWFMDRDGVESFTKRSDEVMRVGHDFSSELIGADVVNSVAVAASGPTVSNTSLANNVWTADVTGVGEIELTATLASGLVLQRLMRFYAAQHDDSTSDYDG